MGQNRFFLFGVPRTPLRGPTNSFGAFDIFDKKCYNNSFFFSMLQVSIFMCDRQAEIFSPN